MYNFHDVASTTSHCCLSVFGSLKVISADTRAFSSAQTRMSFEEEGAWSCKFSFLACSSIKGIMGSR